jgi:hypothetical protein
MQSPQDLDAHARPPDDVQNLYKRYRFPKSKTVTEEELEGVIDLRKNPQEQGLREMGNLVPRFGVEEINTIFRKFGCADSWSQDVTKSPTVYEHNLLPGTYSP